MKTKFLILITYLLFSSTISFCQTTPEDRKFYYTLAEKSYKVVLSDSVNAILKKYSTTSGVPYFVVVKNSGFLKPVFNTNLSKEDRIEACKIGIKQFSGNKDLPLSLFEDVIKQLSK